MSSQKRSITKTVHYPAVFDQDTGTAVYEYLKENIVWDDGIPSRREGFTRKAKPLTYDSDDTVKNLLDIALAKIGGNWDILGVYLNYYRDGNDFTPSHTHNGTSQLVISLGATRHLQLGTKEFALKNGDVIVFGSSAHGVRKEPDVRDGRISIATFMVPKV